MKTMPQEMEVWYLIPSLRKEIALVLSRDYSLRQKEIAKILGITEASVSHYVKSKRGEKIKFSKHEKEIIRECISKIIKNPDDLMKLLYDLCVRLRKEGVLCRMHKLVDKSVAKDCDICKR